MQFEEFFAVGETPQEPAAPFDAAAAAAGPAAAAAAAAAGPTDAAQQQAGGAVIESGKRVAVWRRKQVRASV